MDALHHKALVLTRRPEEAGDLVQETFLRAYRSFASFADGTNCKAWLFTIQIGRASCRERVYSSV